MTSDQTTEQRILEAAKAVFFEKGLNGARMQEIADKAGINKALVHYYFRSKDKLFSAIFEEVSSRVFGRFIAIFRSQDTLEHKIRTFCSAYIDEGISSPYLLSFLFNEINRNPRVIFQQLKGKTNPFMLLRDELTAEIEKGSIRAVNPVNLLLNILSLCAFPIIAKPLLLNAFHIGEQGYLDLMAERKKEVADIIIQYINK